MRDKESAIEWLEYAKRDYESALLLKTHQNPPAIEIICYHCQQAVEKSLKSLLALAGVYIQKTHDIHTLKKLCKKQYPEISDVISDDHADIFSDFATVTRYPDSKKDFSKVDMDFALKYSKPVLDCAERLINTEE